MELVKLLLLIVCSVVLLLVVVPAIVVFFIFRVKDLHKSAQRAKVGVIVGMIVGILLLGVIIWETIDLFLPDTPADTTTESTVESAEASTEAPAPSQTTKATEDLSLIGATISTDLLDGQWIAISEPVIPADEDYTYAANGGYYLFDLGGTFTYTQVQLAKAGTWKALPGQVSYTGTYTLEGDVLTLHYTARTSQTYDPETDSLLVDESVIDETDVVTMRINQSCTQMCVLAPDHPKLGKLFMFQKGRGTDPVSALLIALNGAY